MNMRNQVALNPTKAIVLVDYANVCQIISELLGPDHNADELTVRMIDQLRQHVRETLHMDVVQSNAYDSISSEDPKPHRALAAWLANGIESRLTLLPEARIEAPLHLSIEATMAALQNDRIEAIVVLSGDRWYVPLVRSIRSMGKTIMVACLDAPESRSMVASDLFDCYFNARPLFERAGQEIAGMSTVPIASADYSLNEAIGERKPVQIETVEDSVARHALEIIEQFFGQYEEVYLTPLLRRLTELTETEEEPKVTINYLEDCGAVWLEKRRGFPHNFTVLMVNREHPDVIEIKQEFAQQSEEFAEQDEDFYEDYGATSKENAVRQEQIA